jgi:molecular chaperone GrpE
MTTGPNDDLQTDEAPIAGEHIAGEKTSAPNTLEMARDLLGEDAAPEDMGALLVAKLQAALAEIETLKDAGLRALAEGENIRRRAEREKTEARLYAIDKFARDLVSVADNLGRAIITAPEAFKGDAAFDSYATGVEMTERELQGAFERHGLQKIGAKGDKFDPTFHQAVAQIPSDIPAGEIAEVFQPGYILGGRTLRAAMVAVSAGQSTTQSETES